VATAGAGKNGGGRRKQRQQRGQTKINQKAAAIAAETAIVAAAEMAATETAVAETAAGGGGAADSGRGGNRCGGSGRNVIVNQSIVCFRKCYRISGSTLTRKCLPTYIMYLYLCICKCLFFVAQIKVSRGGFICATNKTVLIETHTLLFGGTFFFNRTDRDLSIVRQQRLMKAFTAIFSVRLIFDT
jgi:hypothetical protein